MEWGSIKFVCICSFFSLIKAADMDYYFGALRSVDCFNQRGENSCRSQCQEGPYLCHKGECYCHSSVLARNSGNIGQESDIKDEMDAAEQSPLRPGLRHHIAHFCPNLDVARTCIRKCMEVGKPAFCGKDHKCYCGHKYSPHDTDKGADVEKTYQGFHDMYEKYFGKRPSDQDTIVESNTY